MVSEDTKICVLGASGMLDNAVLRLFAQSLGYQVFGSVRSSGTLRFLPNECHPCLITGVDVENIDSLWTLVSLRIICL